MGGLQAEGHISLSKAQESEPGCCEDSEELIATSWRGGGCHILERGWHSVWPAIGATPGALDSYKRRGGRKAWSRPLMLALGRCPERHP